MHIKQTTSRLVGKAALLARRPLEVRSSMVATGLLGPNLNQHHRHFSSSANDYSPIYSISHSASEAYHGLKDVLAGQQQQQPARLLANTSAGFFAPSTMTDRQRAISRDPRGNLNVYEDSDHLPSLPVPHLEDTIERLKETIWPIAMNSAEFAHALQLIEQFSKSAGQKLDLLLRCKAAQTKNWMTHDWWTQETYLKSRRPLVINSNPSMIYPKFPFEVNNQRVFINTVAQLISGVIDFKLSLIHGYNPEATSSDNECRLDPNLCYNQYRNLFGSIRLPGEHVDILKSRPLSATSINDEPFNVVISHRGKFFEIQLKDVENENGRINTLTNILDKIIASSLNNKSSDELSANHQSQLDVGPGVLTTQMRDQWAKVFRLLDKDSMDSIQDAQFIVCIDSIPNEPVDQFSSSILSATNMVAHNSEQHLAALARQVLHSDRVNVGNRWFDKTIQLIVVADENSEMLLGAGVNYEHSFAEGLVVNKLIEYSYDKTVQKNRDSTNDNFFAKQQIQSQEPAMFRQLKMFDENNIDTIAEHIKRARQDFISQVDQFDLSYFHYKNYGSNAIKSWQFSPDSWFQVALQWAYYNVHKRLGPCYESASTRRFAYGRTETIRSLTKDVADFCSKPRYDTMLAAIQSHKSYANAANNGAAIDRVLMGYRLVFNELKTNTWSWGLPAASNESEKHNQQELLGPLAERLKKLNKTNGSGQDFELDHLFSEKELNIIGAFFNNELIERSRRFALSTSQITSIHPDICMSYGPMLADGYGCCYSITSHQIVAAITANSSNQSFSCEVEDLNEGLRDSLDKMRDIVEEQQQQQNKNN